MTKETQYMEMPIQCQKCSDFFNLTDGYGSEKWFPNTVICKKCYHEEKREIERDEEIKELESAIEDAEITLRESHERLRELNPDASPIFISIP